MRLLSVLLVLLFCNITFGSIDDIMDATCKLHIGSFVGTGTVFQQTGDYYWIVTAGHLGTPSKDAKIYFYRDGNCCKEIKGEITWRIYKESTTDDIAFCRFKKPDDFEIKTIPLAPENCKLKVDEVILSHGCDNARWPNLWKGKINKLSSEIIQIQPQVYPGRSGSAIFDKDGTNIIGVIVMSYKDNQGLAVPVSKIHKFIEQLNQ